MVWLGQVSSPEIPTFCWQGAWKGTSQPKGVPAGVCDHCPPSLPNCMTLAPQGGVHLLGKLLVIVMARDLHKFLPPRWHLHVWHATLSSPIDTRERALDLQALTSAGAAGHLPPWCQPGMALPHPVFPFQYFLHLLWLGWSQPLPLASIIWPLCVMPPQSGTLGGGNLWASSTLASCSGLSSGSKGAPFSEGHPTLLPGGTRWIVWPSNGAPLAWSHLGTCSGFGFSIVGSHLGISSLMSWGPGPPVSAAARASVAAGASPAGGVAHPFLKDYCHQGPLVGIPHEGHHYLIQVPFCGSKCLIHAAVPSSKLFMGIRPRGISWQLSLFPLQLYRWPLEPEAFLNGVKDLCTEVLLDSLFTSASSG